MTDLSPVAYLTDPGTTEAHFQAGIGNLQGFVTELLGGGPAEALTIATGSVTPTVAFLIVDTEAAAAADDLANIVPTNHGDGKLIAVTSANAARVVTLKHLATGSGQIQLRDSIDAILDSTDKVIFLRRAVTGDKWVEVLRNWGVGPVQTADVKSIWANLGILDRWCGTSTNVGNAYTVVASPVPTALAAGQTYRFIVNAASTGAVTLDVGVGGFKSVTKTGTTALVSGDLPINSVATVTYDGTQHQLVNVIGGTGNMTNTGASVAGQIPKYSDTSGLAIVPGYTVSVSGAANAVAGFDANGFDYGCTKLHWNEKVNALGSGSGARTIDLTLGNSVTATVAGSTTWTFSNPAASGKCEGFTLVLTNGGSAAQTWPASVKWPAATAPTLTAAGRDRLVFTTEDGGTTWDGNKVGLAYA